MKMTYTVPEGHEGQKLSAFIRGRGISGKLWKKIKWTGHITINGEVCHHAKTPLHVGDIISCEWEEFSTVVSSQIPISILYEDEWLLIVNKPAQMIIHPTAKEHYDTLVNVVAGYFAGKGERSGVHPVYRLDRNTTGVVVIAKSAKIQYDLSKNHTSIYREYVALATGRLEKEKGIIEAPIGRKDGSIIEWTVREDGKFARTDYQVIAYGKDFTVLRLHLHTGRTHQIRVHMKYIGHPLLGDDLYSCSDSRIDRQALHAECIHFMHPETGKEISVKAPIPKDMMLIGGCDGGIHY